jgi:hypothetical protein
LPGQLSIEPLAPLPHEAAPPPTEWSVAQAPRSLFVEPAAQPLASAGASSLSSSAAPARTAAPALPGAAQDVRSASLVEAHAIPVTARGHAAGAFSDAFADPPTLATGESPFALEGAPPGAAPSEPRTEAPAAAPLVEIGSIEIVIEEAARAPGAAPEAPARAADFASRFYLRGL